MKMFSFRRSLRILVAASFCWLACGSSVSGLTIVLLTENNGSLTAEETAHRNQFVGWGHSVTNLWDGATQASYDAAMATAHLVFVPEEVSAADVGYKLRYATIGVVLEELGLDAEMGLSTMDSTSSAQTNLTITDPAFGGGTIPIFWSAQPATAMQGTFAPGLHTVAVNASAQRMLCIMEAGAVLANAYSGNSTAAGRRVRLPMGGDSFTFSSLNSAGLTVLQMAIAWAGANPLLLHLKFDELAGATAVDASTYARNGAYSGAVALGGIGVRDRSALFGSTGSSDKLILSDTILDGQTNLSTLFWIKTTHTGQQTVISANRASSDNVFVVIFSSATQLQIQYNGASRTWNIPSIADGKWHHLAIITNAESNQTTVYCDNVSAGTQAFSPGVTALQIDANGLMIGQEQDCLNGCFDAGQVLKGAIDDLCIHSRILTAKEVSAHYGELGRWSFDEMAGTVAADGTPFANHATFSSGVPTWVSGVRGGALQFDGASDAATGSPLLPPDAGTVAFWFRSDGPHVGRHRLFGLGGSWEVWQDPDGLLRFDLDTDGFVGHFETVSSLITAGGWYHIAAIYDAADDSYSVYVNGVLEKTGVSASPIATQPAAALTFGARTGLSSERLSGALDDVRIYNRKLTMGEINELYGLVGWYKLDESNGTVAADSSGLNNDGAYGGGPTLGVASNGLAAQGTAVAFSGTNYVQIPGEFGMPSSVSFTAWAKLGAPDTSGAELFSIGDQFFIRLQNGNPGARAYYYNGSSWINAPTLQAISKDWHHYAAVLSGGSTLKLYLDGVEVGSVAASTPISYSNLGGNSLIASHGNGDTAYDFAGRIDDVRVFNRAIVPEEVMQIYNGSRAPGVRLIRWVETR